MDIHPRGYFLTDFFGVAIEQDYLHDEWQPLREALADLFGAGATVNDFGCGGGTYVANLRRRGVDAIGLDGNPLTAQHAHCSVADLTAADLTVRVADWVLCLEVAEHIPADYETPLLANIDRHNIRGVVISWAVPGQGGHGHVNEQSNDYVRRRFAAMGYEPDDAAEQRLRAAGVKWFKNTMMVYRKRNSS